MKLTLKEKFILTGLPCFLCIILVLITNIRTVYLLEATLISSEPQIGQLQSGALKGMNRSTRKLLRQSIGLQRTNSIQDFHGKLAILESRQFIGAFINEQHLKPKMFPKRWNGSNKAEFPDWKAIEFFQKAIAIKQQNNSNIIVLRLRWRDPETGAQVLNAFIDYANLYISTEKRKRVEGTIAKMNEQLLLETMPSMKRLLAEQIESMTAMLITQNSQLSPAFTVIDNAVAPLEPLFRVPKVLLAVGFIFGLVCSSIYLAIQRLKKYAPNPSLISTGI